MIKDKTYDHLFPICQDDFQAVLTFDAGLTELPEVAEIYLALSFKGPPDPKTIVGKAVLYHGQGKGTRENTTLTLEGPQGYKIDTGIYNIYIYCIFILYIYI